MSARDTRDTRDMQDKKQKRGPGRPRLNPEGTQKELARKAREARLLNQDGEKARHEMARREVQRTIREVFAETPWFTKILAKLFMKSAQRVAAAKLDIEPENLGKFVSEGFARVLAECASFEGLSRASRTSVKPISVSGVVAAAATPNLGGFAEDTLGDFADLHDFAGHDDDEEEELYRRPLPPMSDQEAEQMGFLPEV